MTRFPDDAIPDGLGLAPARSRAAADALARAPKTDYPLVGRVKTVVFALAACGLTSATSADAPLSMGEIAQRRDGVAAGMGGFALALAQAGAAGERDLAGIGAGSPVIYDQPAASALAFNSGRSLFHGADAGRGLGFLINPNGMVFGRAAAAGAGAWLAVPARGISAADYATSATEHVPNRASARDGHGSLRAPAFGELTFAAANIAGERLTLSVNDLVRLNFEAADADAGASIDRADDLPVLHEVVDFPLAAPSAAPAAPSVRAAVMPSFAYTYGNLAFFDPAALQPLPGGAPRAAAPAVHEPQPQGVANADPPRADTAIAANPPDPAWACDDINVIAPPPFDAGSAATPAALTSLPGNSRPFDVRRGQDDALFFPSLPLRERGRERGGGSDFTSLSIATPPSPQPLSREGRGAYPAPRSLVESPQIPEKMSALGGRSDISLASGRDEKTSPSNVQRPPPLPISPAPVVSEAPAPAVAPPAPVSVPAPAAAAPEDIFAPRDFAAMPLEDQLDLFSKRHDQMAQALCLGLLKLGLRPALADTPVALRGVRGQGVCLQLEKTAAAKKSAQAVARKIACVIGIDDYQSELIPPLNSAVNDAEAVAALLRERLNYSVHLVHNGGKAECIRAFNQVIRLAGPLDSVIIYFAGRGYFNEYLQTGYWLARDSRPEDPQSWLSNHDVAEVIKAVQARQILLLADGPFGGLPANDLRKLVSPPATPSQPARALVAITSGGDQPVEDIRLQDRSIFTARLLDALHAVKPGFTAAALFNDLFAATDGALAQSPRYFASRNAQGQGRADFVLLDAPPRRKRGAGIRTQSALA